VAATAALAGSALSTARACDSSTMCALTGGRGGDGTGGAGSRGGGGCVVCSFLGEWGSDAPGGPSWAQLHLWVASLTEPVRTGLRLIIPG